MTPLFKKLNFKDHPSILVMNGPDSFIKEQESMSGFTSLTTDLHSAETFSFVIAFATQKTQIDQTISVLHKRLKGDAILWFAYPKGTSKKYKCDFNRDTGWTELGRFGFEPVRQVAIDADWSALRFRRIEYIKTLTRRKSMTLTTEGNVRTSGK